MKNILLKIFKIEKWKNALRKIFSLPIANGTYKGKNKDIEH